VRLRTLALACALAAVTLSACGTTAKPVAGSASLDRTKPAGRGVVDDLRTSHLRCLRAHFTVTKRGTSDLLIGTGTEQVTASFAPTPGAAQEEQISGHVQGAEVIGSALLYPGNAPDGRLKTIEGCLAEGVSG
jgi:hypothetical protein